MATKEEILAALSSQEGRISTADLAEKVGTTEGSIRSHLSKLKTKKYADGNAKDGWLVTSEGSEAVEREEKIPTDAKEVGADTESKLKYYGALATVDADLILACNELILTGDPEDLDHVWDSMTYMDVPIMARRKWWHLWRNYLQQAIPPNLKDKVGGTSDTPAGEDGEHPGKGRDYIILDDTPVPVGDGLGDYNLEDAKDILQIRALRNRFSGPGQGPAPGIEGSQGGSPEKVSDLLRELAPYLINKGGDDETLRELISTQMELQKQEILSHIPPPGNPAQPKPLMEQITGFVAALGSLKESGPLLRSILGVPEPSNNPPSAGTLARVKGPDGSPTIMDLGEVIDWTKFLNTERREDERHGTLMRLGETVRENIPDGIQAILKAASEVKGGAETKTDPATQQPPQVKCSCGVLIELPASNWLEIECPNCHVVWTLEQVKEALGV